MIEAAIAVFVENGWNGTRMADIAERAGVAVQTLYFTFHTKPELLEACYHHAVTGGPDGLRPMDTPELQQAFTSRSGRAALRSFAKGNTAITSRAAAVDAVAAAAAHEPDVLRVRNNSEALRRENFEALARSLDQRFELRTDTRTAADLLMVLAGGPTYLALTGCGWTDEQFTDWLADTLATQLLKHPGRARTAYGG
jgi:AcrR family transcriptional regulator